LGGRGFGFCVIAVLRVIAATHHPDRMKIARSWITMGQCVLCCFFDRNGGIFMRAGSGAACEERTMRGSLARS
jgi:hypothetical protein